MKLSKGTLNNLNEEVIESREVHRGKSFSFHSDKVRLPNGKTAQKDYVRYPHAVAIVPFIEPNKVILIKQFRYPVGKVIYEIPAGKVEGFEEIRLEAAQRELLEETGYRAKCFDFLFSFYPSAGYSTEILHIYKACELSRETQYLDEDEFIETEIVKFDSALEMIRKGEIMDPKTITALLYIKAFCS